MTGLEATIGVELLARPASSFTVPPPVLGVRTKPRTPVDGYSAIPCPTCGATEQLCEECATELSEATRNG